LEFGIFSSAISAFSEVDVFILRRGEVGKMDMESDMCDGDMDMPGIFRPMIINHPPLDCL
jgi:hypothetical protein